MYLTLRGLHKKHGSIAAVNNVSLAVKEGELVSVLGPSGCGKTTLLRLVSGLQFPDSGSIFLDGEDITKKAAEKRSTATVFQNYALFPHMTVRENIAYGMKFLQLTKEEKEKRMEEMLSLFNIARYAESDVNVLSGGEQQRVALARAIILQPKVLLMDEPLSSLDAKLKESMLWEIRSLQKRLKITVLYVTHDQWEAMSVADKIVLMRAGSIEQEGSAEELYDAPKNRFVAEFLGSVNVFVHQGRKLWIRPEKIRLTAAEHEVNIKGVITQKIFCGSYTVYMVEIGGQNLEVHVDNGKTRVWYVGEEVGVNILADMAVG